MDNFTTMTVGERIKYLRKNLLNLSLEKFGKKIGVTKTAITHVEKGRNALTDQMCKSICREYNVNYAWLMYGEGDIFIDSDAEIYELIDRIMSDDSEYHKFLIKQVAKLNKDQIQTIKQLIEYFTLKEKGEL